MTHDDLEVQVHGVRVVRWDPIRGDRLEQRSVGNFGDLLGPLLVEALARGRSSPSVGAPRLLGLGSVLHFAKPGDVVWGTGANGKITVAPIAPLDVRAVRGPLTLGVLRRAGIRAPRIFGDPALLLPKLRPDLLTSPHVSGGVLDIANLNDPTVRAPGTHVVDSRSPVPHVLSAIAGSALVIASSLHAIIVAESLGIPARAYRSTAEGAFKYRDYYLGTGRPQVVIAADREEAIRLGGAPSPEVDLDELVAAFPSDLWGAPKPPRPRDGRPKPIEVAAGYLDHGTRGRPSSALVLADEAELRTVVLARFATGSDSLGDRRLLARCIVAFLEDQPGSAERLQIAGYGAALTEAMGLARSVAPPERGPRLP